MTDNLYRNIHVNTLAIAFYAGGKLHTHKYGLHVHKHMYRHNDVGDNAKKSCVFEIQCDSVRRGSQTSDHFMCKHFITLKVCAKFALALC